MLSFSFLSLLPFFFLQIWPCEGFECSIPLLFLLYVPKHYCDRRPKRVKMSFEEFTEFMERINATEIQQVVEWWRISSMAHHSLKDNCVPLVKIGRASCRERV